MNIHKISEELDTNSDRGLATRKSQHVQPLRGLRGTPASEVAKCIAKIWRKEKPSLFDSADDLHSLFLTAHEDGLVAIGIAAAGLTDDADIAMDLATRWLDMTDDVETADAIGWLLLGPALLTTGSWGSINRWAGDHRPVVRRAAVMACMSALPVPIEGPAAAGLRERAGEKHLTIVDAPQSRLVSSVMARTFRDSDPLVLKAVARVLRSWGENDPEAVVVFLENIVGGIAKRLREHAQKGIRKGRRIKQDQSEE
jgi:hypothetical protein